MSKTIVSKHLFCFFKQPCCLLAETLFIQISPHFLRCVGFLLCEEQLTFSQVLQHYYKFHFCCNMQHHHFLRKLRCMRRPQSNPPLSIHRGALHLTAQEIFHTELTLHIVRWNSAHSESTFDVLCEYCMLCTCISVYVCG